MFPISQPAALPAPENGRVHPSSSIRNQGRTEAVCVFSPPSLLLMS